MDNVIRQALMGDRKSQEECTDKGIVLPCPPCSADWKVWGVCRLWGF